MPHTGLLTKVGTTAPTSKVAAFKAGASSLALHEGLGLVGEGIEGFTLFDERIAETKEIRFAAKQEEIKGAQAAANFLEEFNNIAASNIVLAFAQGRQLSGSVTQIQQDLGLQAGHAISIATINAKITSLALTRRADEAEALARWEKKVAPFKIITGAALAWAGI